MDTTDNRLPGSAFASEPIFWTVTNHAVNNYHGPDRERVAFDGSGRVERIPQRGHVGDYNNRGFAPGHRSVLMVRHDGHVVEVVLTTAAACMDPDANYGRYVKGKAFALGWFQLSRCPVALLKAGHLRADRLVEPALFDAQACEPGTYDRRNPCPHALAELEVRRRKTADFEAKRPAPDAQHKEMIATQREQTERLVDAITQAMASRPAAASGTLDVLVQLATAQPEALAKLLALVSPAPPAPAPEATAPPPEPPPTPPADPIPPAPAAPETPRNPGRGRGDKGDR